MIASEARKITEENRDVYFKKIKESAYKKISEMAHLGFSNIEFFCDREYILDLEKVLFAEGYQLSRLGDDHLFITW